MERKIEFSRLPFLYILGFTFCIVAFAFGDFFIKSDSQRNYFEFVVLAGVIFWLHRWYIIRVKKQVLYLHDQSKQLSNGINVLNYAVGHDLKAPIGSTERVLNELETQLGQNLTEEVKSSLTRLRTLNQEAKVLIEGLLRFAEYDHLPVKKGVFEVTRVSQYLAQSLQEDHSTRKLEFIIQDIPNIDGDPLLLRKVMVNLLRNAVKFTSAKSPAKIEVYSKTLNDRYEIYVKDNGVGFPSEKAHLIFEPFKTAHDRKEYPGSGIGLSICKHIIERHGGEMWGQNNPEGEGVTFGFSIPKTKR